MAALSSRGPRGIWLMSNTMIPPHQLVHALIMTVVKLGSISFWDGNLSDLLIRRFLARLLDDDWQQQRTRL